MGIKGLNNFIKSNNPKYEEILSSEKFRNQSIAIDTNNWIYIQNACARKKVIEKTDLLTEEVSVKEIRKTVLVGISSFLNLLVKHKIHPVFVFDGVTSDKKEDTKNKRRESQKKHLQNITQLKTELTEDILTINLEKLKKLKLETTNLSSISRNDILYYKQFIECLGFPVIQAESEGEKLCAQLCKEGKVAAVFSTDTDLFVYGCPISIKKMNYDENTLTFVCVRLEVILQSLDLSYSEFIEFCILCGCDYNKNIPGIGPVRGLRLIKEYKSIEKLPEKFNTANLNYDICKELFTKEENTIHENLLCYREEITDEEDEFLSNTNHKYLRVLFLESYKKE